MRGQVAVHSAASVFICAIAAKGKVRKMKRNDIEEIGEPLKACKERDGLHGK